MALGIQYTKNIYGENLIFKNAYLQITNIEGNKNEIILRTTLYSNNSKNYILKDESYSIVPNLNGLDNFIKQGYEYLKTLEEYKDSIDLLDEGQTV